MRKYVFVAALGILSAGVVGSAAWAADPPPLGENVEFEYIGSSLRIGNWYHYQFALPIKQGDRFRFQATPVGGAELPTCIRVAIQTEKGAGGTLEESGWGLNHDWTMAKVPPGSMIYVDVMSQALGKVRLRVTKVGVGGEDHVIAPIPAPDSVAEIEKLQALVEDLRRRNADLEDQIAVLKSQKGSR